MSAPTVPRPRPDERCAWCGLKLAADRERPEHRGERWYHSTCPKTPHEA